MGLRANFMYKRNVDRLLNITSISGFRVSVSHHNNACPFIEASVFTLHMDTDSADSPAHQTCSKCRKSLPRDISNFKLAREGFSKLCRLCLEKSSQQAAQKKHGDSNKENLPAPNGDPSDLSIVDLNTFLESLGSFSDLEDVISLEACVDLSSLKTKADDERIIADSLAGKIWEQLKYRFV